MSYLSVKIDTTVILPDIAWRNLEKVATVVSYSQLTSTFVLRPVNAVIPNYTWILSIQKREPTENAVTINPTRLKVE